MKIALNAESYREPDVYKVERQSIWATEWVMFCTTAELAKSGDYFAGEIAGFNLLLAVNPEGSIVGFHNVCPHRAGVLAWPGQGTLGNLVCKYHGWAFGWDGALKSARDFGNEEPLCAEHSELKKVRVETWGPLVFVCLSESTPPLNQTFVSLIEETLIFAAISSSHTQRTSRELEGNWNIFTDPRLQKFRADAEDESLFTGGLFFHYPNMFIQIDADNMEVERIMPIGQGKTQILYDNFSITKS
jgi:choline monooxygenase